MLARFTKPVEISPAPLRICPERRFGDPAASRFRAEAEKPRCSKEKPTQLRHGLWHRSGRRDITHTRGREPDAA